MDRPALILLACAVAAPAGWMLVGSQSADRPPTQSKSTAPDHESPGRVVPAMALTTSPATPVHQASNAMVRFARLPEVGPDAEEFASESEQGSLFGPPSLPGEDSPARRWRSIPPERLPAEVTVVDAIRLPVVTTDPPALPETLPQTISDVEVAEVEPLPEVDEGELSDVELSESSPQRLPDLPFEERQEDAIDATVKFSPSNEVETLPEVDDAELSEVVASETNPERLPALPYEESSEDAIDATVKFLPVEEAEEVQEDRREIASGDEEAMEGPAPLVAAETEELEESRYPELGNEVSNSFALKDVAEPLDDAVVEAPEESAAVAPESTAALEPLPVVARQAAQPVARRAWGRDMQVVEDLAARHVRRGFALAGMHAYFSARGEFVAALRMISQALDSRDGGNERTRALANGLKALEESDEFVPLPTELEGDIDVAMRALVHRTPVLKDAADAEQTTPMVARQRYYTYAARQLAHAVDEGRSGSMALYGLARLESALFAENPSRHVSAESKAMTLHQAALLANADNYMAANELGVLAARFGQLDVARVMLQKSARGAAQVDVWNNLAIVHQQLGETHLAAAAKAEAENARRRSLQGGGAPSTYPVVWTDPAEFARTGSATDGRIVNQPASGPAK